MASAKWKSSQVAGENVSDLYNFGLCEPYVVTVTKLTAKAKTQFSYLLHEAFSRESTKRAVSFLLLLTRVLKSFKFCKQRDWHFQWQIQDRSTLTTSLHLCAGRLTSATHTATGAGNSHSSTNIIRKIFQEKGIINQPVEIKRWAKTIKKKERHTDTHSDWKVSHIC